MPSCQKLQIKKPALINLPPCRAESRDREREPFPYGGKEVQMSNGTSQLHEGKSSDQTRSYILHCYLGG